MHQITYQVLESVRIVYICLLTIREVSSVHGPSLSSTEVRKNKRGVGGGGGAGTRKPKKMTLPVVNATAPHANKIYSKIALPSSSKFTHPLNIMPKK